MSLARIARPALRSASLARSVVAPSLNVRAAHFNAVAARPALTAATRPSIIATMATAAATTPKAGDAFPSVAIRTQDKDTTVDFSKLPGKTVIVTVPGAFTPACHSQVPTYYKRYDEFKAKGVNDIYVVSVNDLFVVNAWKKDLIGDANTVKFAADDKGDLARALNIVLDARPGLGTERLQRSLWILQDGKIVHSFVEPNSGKATGSHGEEAIKQL